MSFDASRQLYPHSTCGTLPCSCVREHKPLVVQTFTCKECSRLFYTVNDLAEHHLDNHSSVPLDLTKFKVEEHRNGSSS